MVVDDDDDDDDDDDGGNDANDDDDVDDVDDSGDSVQEFGDDGAADDADLRAAVEAQLAAEHSAVAQPAKTKRAKVDAATAVDGPDWSAVEREAERLAKQLWQGNGAHLVSVRPVDETWRSWIAEPGAGAVPAVGATTLVDVSAWIPNTANR